MFLPSFSFHLNQATYTTAIITTITTTNIETDEMVQTYGSTFQVRYFVPGQMITLFFPPLSHPSFCDPLVLLLSFSSDNHHHNLRVSQRCSLHNNQRGKNAQSILSFPRSLLAFALRVTSFLFISSISLTFLFSLHLFLVFDCFVLLSHPSKPSGQPTHQVPIPAIYPYEIQ